MENFHVGGFTSFRSFDQDEKEMMERITGQLDGVQHLPLAVATQVVAGTNYAFLCESKAVSPDGVSFNALVIIHKPLPNVDELPILMEIKRVKII